MFYGEKEFFKIFEGWNCDMREDIVMFGSCFDCWKIINLNFGCCIGLYEFLNGSGFVGFLVKENDFILERVGFFIVVYVVVGNWCDLYYLNFLLLILDGFFFEYRIVYLLLLI